MRSRRQGFSALCIVTAVLGCVAGPASGQVAFDRPPIDYLNGELRDPVHLLQQKIDAGTAELVYDENRGYLESVLELFGIQPSSQVLVFSKTSFQLRRISPQSPRALYFNDQVSVGWVPGGDVMEITAVDPRQGAIFYTVDQRRSDPPRFTRRTHACLQCHNSSLTQGVPGHLVRSVTPASDGRPVLRAGTFLTDHTSPFDERWGGWYVTGTHGSQRHLGNVFLPGDGDSGELDTDAGSNVTNLEEKFATSMYLTGHSDLVALMVLEHQSQMHNLITRASYLTRVAMNESRVMNEMLGKPLDHLSESTRRRISYAAEPLVEYLLFSKEAPLTEPIAGTSEFTSEFSTRGPRDQEGRSLREFDLQRRLFKYPCSFLIYSDAFKELPEAVREVVDRRLWEILRGEDPTEPFQHLDDDTSQAILEILCDTRSGLPDYWELPSERPPP